MGVCPVISFFPSFSLHSSSEHASHFPYSSEEPRKPEKYVIPLFFPLLFYAHHLPKAFKCGTIVRTMSQCEDPALSPIMPRCVPCLSFLISHFYNVFEHSANTQDNKSLDNDKGDTGTLVPIFLFFSLSLIPFPHPPCDVMMQPHRPSTMMIWTYVTTTMPLPRVPHLHMMSRLHLHGLCVMIAGKIAAG